MYFNGTGQSYLACQSCGSKRCPGCTLQRTAGPARLHPLDAQRGGMIHYAAAPAPKAAAAARPQDSLSPVETQQQPHKPPAGKAAVRPAAACHAHIPDRGINYRRNAAAVGELIGETGCWPMGLHLHQESSPARAQPRGQGIAISINGTSPQGSRRRPLTTWVP